VWRDNRKEEK